MDLQALLPKVALATSSTVQDLCATVAPNSTPVYLNVETFSGAVVNECYRNVENIIKEKGGRTQYGWQIWETIPNRIVEAEFHAVWVDPEGVYHDITPKGHPSVTQILFLPDTERRYEGRQIDSVRVPVNDTDNLAKRIIKNAENYFIASNRGDLADQHGMITATPEMLVLYKEKQELSMELINGVKVKPATISSALKPGRNSPCPCGSGKKYKKCHGG